MSQTPPDKQQAQQQAQQPPPSILKSAAAMSAATFLSRVLGMVRDMVMAMNFPPIVTDAFVVAFRLPNLFRRILGEGSLSASFIPLYVEASQKDAAQTATNTTQDAKIFASQILSMLLALTTTLTVLGIIFMPQIISSWVSGDAYASVQGKVELTIWLARIMFVYFFLVMTYAYLMALANAHHAFFWAGLAPAGFNLTVIIAAFLPHYKLPGDQLAVGVVVAGVVQLLFTLWPLFKLKKIPGLTWQWWGPGTQKFFKILLPSMLGMSVGQLLGILNVNFTSRLGQGSHSFIYFADRLLEFPQALMSVSLGVALLPTLSGLWARGENNKFLETVQRHVRLLMVLMLPAAVGLYVLAEPIVRVLFGRGQFTEAAISATAMVTQIYAVVLVVTGLHRVTVPAFYAIKNTWLPAANAAVCLVVHYFVASWAVDHHGLAGLVWATAFTGALNLALLLISFRIIFGSLGVWDFLRSTLWLVPAVVAMGYATPIIYHLAHVYWGATPALVATLPVAGAIYFIVAWATRHPEAKDVAAMLKRRLKVPPQKS